MIGRCFVVLLVLLGLASCDASRPVNVDDVPGVGARIEGARVDHVKDGDSLVVQHRGRSLEVRLFGIDAPEKDQPYARESRQVARRMLDDRTIDLMIRDVDRYDRLVAEVFVSGQTTSVNLQLIGEGAAWAYTRYARDPAFQRSQDEARSRRVGLWSLPDETRVPPWQWRKRNTAR